MENNFFLEEVITRYPQLLPVKGAIRKAADCIVACYEQGGKLLVCGNGGSCSNSDHIVGELMKGFENKRRITESLKNQLIEASGERGAYLAEKLQHALPAISLTAHSALITAVANDTDAEIGRAHV